MQFDQTAYLCHVVEDIFYEVKQNRLTLNSQLADQLFAVFDSLTTSIDSIEKNNSESPLNQTAENLKEITGVKTTGVGRSIRDQTTTNAKPLVLPQNDQPFPVTKTIAVKIESLDELMNLLEEYLIQRLTFKKYIDQLGIIQLKEYYQRSKRVLDDLQYQVMKLRTIPLKLVFDHFPRAVRDLARSANKKIDIKIIGADLELDRLIVDRLDEPIIHLIRNAVSHGIEKEGLITLSAERVADYVVVTVEDNGKGIDWEAVAQKAGVKTQNRQVLKKILFSGISTSPEVTQISGRGVGLQVVKKMVEGFGGFIDAESEKGQGAKFKLKLPLTLAVGKALLVQINNQRYAIPTLVIDRSIKISHYEIIKINNQDYIRYDNQSIPLIWLAYKLKVNHTNLTQTRDDSEVLIATLEGRKVGLVVDDIVEMIDIIIKPVPEILRQIPYFSGTTVLGDGRIIFIINPGGFVR